MGCAVAERALAPSAVLEDVAVLQQDGGTW